MACYVYILSPAVLSAVPPLLFLLLIITTTSNNNNNNNNNNSNNNNDKQINTNKYKTSEAFLSRGLETGQVRPTVKPIPNRLNSHTNILSIFFCLF